MKEFSCCMQHQFNADEVKEWVGSRPACPFCWPNGFRTGANQNIDPDFVKMIPGISEELMGKAE